MRDVENLGNNTPQITSSLPHFITQVHMTMCAIANGVRESSPCESPSKLRRRGSVRRNGAVKAQFIALANNTAITTRTSSNARK